MTLAAIDRLVHHAIVLEMNVESYRRKGRAQTQAWQRLTVIATEPH
jgi:DNA replication protein DnaC